MEHDAFSVNKHIICVRVDSALLAWGALLCLMSLVLMTIAIVWSVVYHPQWLTNLFIVCVILWNLNSFMWSQLGIMIRFRFISSNSQSRLCFKSGQRTDYTRSNCQFELSTVYRAKLYPSGTVCLCFVFLAVLSNLLYLCPCQFFWKSMISYVKSCILPCYLLFRIYLFMIIIGIPRLGFHVCCPYYLDYFPCLTCFIFTCLAYVTCWARNDHVLSLLDVFGIDRSFKASA